MHREPQGTPRSTVLAVSIHAGWTPAKLPIDKKRFLAIFGKPIVKFANGCSRFRYFGHR
jgi:hypothetical protein